MGKKQRLKRERMQNSIEGLIPLAPMGEDGLHAIGIGDAPTAAELGKMSEEFQRRIRNSPLWQQMVREHGEQRAEELLRQCKAKLN